MANTLSLLGVGRAWFVRGNDGRGAAPLVAGRTDDPARAARLAEEGIDSGAAPLKPDQFVGATNACGRHGQN